MNEPREATAETLTDELIREFRKTVLESDSVPYSIQQWDGLLHAVKIALGELPSLTKRRYKAKLHIAAAINASMKKGAK